MTTSPEELVSSFYSIVSERGITALPDYIHSADLTKFKKAMIPAYELIFASGNDAEILGDFTHGDTFEQVQNYSPKMFFSRFLNSAKGHIPQIQEILDQTTIKPIGHIMENVEGDEVIHVVYRKSYTVEGIGVSDLSVVSLQQDGDDVWKLLFTSDMKLIIKALEKRLKPSEVSNEETKAVNPK